MFFLLGFQWFHPHTECKDVNVQDFLTFSARKKSLNCPSPETIEYCKLCTKERWNKICRKKHCAKYGNGKQNIKILENKAKKRKINVEKIEQI